MPEILALIRSHAWLAVATLVIAAGLAAAKSPATGSLFARVPREQRPRIVLVLGLLSGILDAITRGTPWPEALAYGVVSAALAALGHGAAGGLTPTDALQPGEVRGTAPPGGKVTIEMSTAADILPRPPASSAAPTILTLPDPDLDFSKDPKPSVKP